MINEKGLLLRGFVTPDDFPEETYEPLQAALDLAVSLDIRKVIVSEDYTAKGAILLPAGIHLVIQSASLTADLKAKAPANCSFFLDHIYIEGRNGTVAGDISLYNTMHAVIEKLDIDGNVTLAFARKTRIEDVTLSGSFTVGRGTAVLIAQRLNAKDAVIESTDKGEDVVGLEPTVRSVAFRDSVVKNGVLLKAAEDFGLLNVQVDHLSGDVTIGDENASIPADNYFNLTVTDINGEVKCLSETKNLSL